HDHRPQTGVLLHGTNRCLDEDLLALPGDHPPEYSQREMAILQPQMATDPITVRHRLLHQVEIHWVVNSGDLLPGKDRRVHTFGDVVRDRDRAEHVAQRVAPLVPSTIEVPKVNDTGNLLEM